jgi:hypothetical protein
VPLLTYRDGTCGLLHVFIIESKEKNMNERSLEVMAANMPWALRERIDATQIDDFFDREIKQNRVPGAVVGIARDGKLVLPKAMAIRTTSAASRCRSIRSSALNR